MLKAEDDIVMGEACASVECTAMRFVYIENKVVNFVAYYLQHYFLCVCHEWLELKLHISVDVFARSISDHLRSATRKTVCQFTYWYLTISCILYVFYHLVNTTNGL